MVREPCDLNSSIANPTVEKVKANESIKDSSSKQRTAEFDGI